MRGVLEIGIGEDTAPSAAAWADYFPNAYIYSIDVKARAEFARRAAHGGAAERLAARQAKFGCEYNASMWLDRRLSLTLGVDATRADQLTAALPSQALDVIIDDGSHKFLDQQTTLHTLWPQLRPGGFYVVEDLLVGALPWSAAHAEQVPTANDGCGSECFFPQRPAEHPWLFDRFGANKRGRELEAKHAQLSDESRALLRDNDWFWTITGVHRGGGVDAALIIRKKGQPLLQDDAAAAAAAAAPAEEASGHDARRGGARRAAGDRRDAAGGRRGRWSR